jgi:diguanylate cyclase (GGDEF)-like protein/PAS domain S-box-containing protein
MDLVDETADPDDPRVQAALLEFSSEFLVFTDQRGALVAAAGSGLGPSGFSPDLAQSGRHIAERVHPDDLASVLDIIERARADPDFLGSIRSRARDDAGRWRVLESTVIGVASHPVLGAGAALRIREVNEAPAADTGRFLSLAEVVPFGVLSGDARGWVVFTNDRAGEILGLEPDAVLAHGWRRVIHPDDLEDVVDAGENAVRLGIQQQATFRLQGDDGTRWVTLVVVPLVRPGRSVGWVATLDDITVRYRTETRLAHQATHDALTGLPNRALLEDRLEQAVTRVGRTPEQLSLLFVDLDGFKEVNDRLGHQAGDAVLRQAADRIASVLRPSDTLARFGGDEFVIVLEGMGSREAALLARRIEEGMTAAFAVDGGEVTVGASVGSATATGAETGLELLSRADEAMYGAKRRA